MSNNLNIDNVSKTEIHTDEESKTEESLLQKQT